MSLFKHLVKRSPDSTYVDSVPSDYPVMNYPVEVINSNGDKTIVLRDEDRLSDDGLTYDFYNSENCSKLGINPIGSILGDDPLLAAESAEDAIKNMSNK